MVENSEICGCPDNNSSVEFACNCSEALVYLCSRCIVNHFGLPKAHIFISLEQARELKNAKISQKKSENAEKAQKIDESFKTYISEISGFNTRVKDFKSRIAQAINQKCDRQTDFLNNLLAKTQARWTEVSKQLGDLSSSDSEILTKYEDQGLAGLIEEYYQEFSLYEEEVIESINDMIYIGNQVKISKTQDLTDQINALKKKNEEMKVYLDKFTPQPKYDLPIIQEMKEMSYQDLKMRFEYKINYQGLIEYDKALKSERNFNLSNIQTIRCDHNASCIQTPDRQVIIIPNAGIERYRFNPMNCSLLRLQDLKTPYSHPTFYFSGDYLYAFGGKKTSYPSYQRVEDNLYLTQAGRMNWRSNEWEILADMEKANSDMACYETGNSFYLIGGQAQLVQRYDVIENKFYFVSSLSFSIIGGIVSEIDELLYISSGGNLTICTKSFKLLSTFNKVKRDGTFHLVTKPDDPAGHFIISLQENQLIFHQDEDHNLEIVKTVLF